MILSFGGKTPRDEGAVFVAANATVLGDVTLGKGTNIWYGAVLRGDEGTLVLGENCNVQDNAVLHCDPGGQVLLGRTSRWATAPSPTAAQWGKTASSGCTPPCSTTLS